LYGVDLITSGGKPYIVDINTFPGFKGVPNAAQLLADFVVSYT
jgi:glutathione synthase/RimK-type ligase-like ATP-grasp enzyme